MSKRSFENQFHTYIFEYWLYANKNNVIYLNFLTIWCVKYWNTIIHSFIYLLSVRLLIWRVKLMRISGKRFPRWFREHLESSVRRTGMPISFDKEQKLNYQIIISNSISISSTFYRICSEPYWILQHLFFPRICV